TTAARQVESRSHVCVESNSGQVRKVMTVDVADIDAARLGGERFGNRLLRNAADAELARQTVARAGWNHPDRHRTEREPPHNLVDRPVAAPYQHEPHAALGGGARDLSCVAPALGQKNLTRVPVALDGSRRTLGTLARPIRTRATGNWVDDDCDGQG